ncbi:MAG: recombinase family protein [Oscillospiraceae bacterium]|nr:recombinase family protein [Oscillospiraceae bacterium]
MDLLKTRRQLDSGKTIFDLPLRVVYYARVSTDRDEQLNSLENQVNYYDDYINSNPNWTYVGGYIDEGMSGTSVEKRGNFLKMIAAAKDRLFDLVVTKEISRFSRSTLDSIKYTQELLDCGVGVFFQSDNINTLYTDAELRLTIMSSIAQDEMRRLSERVKFGMKRAYESGKVLGSDNIYGYNKAGGKLEINEEEANFVRDLFQIYADNKYGYRTIARMLTEKGYRSKVGKEINPATLKGIISNPKYKGYYHGRLTESSDYRTKKNVKLSQDERLYYKDDSIPAIVSEELWNRANRILQARNEKHKKQSSATQKRFAYSGKIMCEEHGTYHYRKVWKDRKVPAESWCCREYLAKGRKACETPHVYTKNLDAILKRVGNDLLRDKQKHMSRVDDLLKLYAQAQGNVDYAKEIAKANTLIVQHERRKKKSRELYLDGDFSKEEYLTYNEEVAVTIGNLEKKIEKLKAEQNSAGNKSAALKQAKVFFDNLSKSDQSSMLVAQEMLNEVLVLKDSTKKHTKLQITMKYGEVFPATIANTNILCRNTEVSPIVGTEKQSEELVHYLLKEFEVEPQKIWESNIFGKSLHELVNEGLHNKLYKMPDDAQEKLQETLQKIINEGSGGLICIIL